MNRFLINVHLLIIHASWIFMYLECYIYIYAALCNHFVIKEVTRKVIQAWFKCISFLCYSCFSYKNEKAVLIINYENCCSNQNLINNIAILHCQFEISIVSWKVWSCQNWYCFMSNWRIYMKWSDTYWSLTKKILFSYHNICI